MKRTTSPHPESQFSLIFGSDQSRQNSISDNNQCEHYLKIGCNNNINSLKDYSINKKCQYSFSKHHEQNNFQKKDLLKQYSYDSLVQYKALTRRVPILPVTESESNRICLAFWLLDPPSNNYYEKNEDSEKDNRFIVLSKSTNSAVFTVTCSVRG